MFAFKCSCRKKNQKVTITFGIKFYVRNKERRKTCGIKMERTSSLVEVKFSFPGSRVSCRYFGERSSSVRRSTSLDEFDFLCRCELERGRRREEIGRDLPPRPRTCAKAGSRVVTR